LDLPVEDHPDADILGQLEARLAESTFAATGRSGASELAIFVREGGVLKAGIYGWTWGGCCELQYLWVDESLRQTGLGSKLLQAAEDEAAARGCTQVVLFTHASQAPGFYPRRGYELVASIDDYPQGDAALWFRKPLVSAS